MELLTRPLTRVLKIADSVILDFSDVLSLDSDDLADLASIISSTGQQGNNVAFVKVDPSLREFLSASQIDKTVSIFSTVDEAVARFEK